VIFIAVPTPPQPDGSVDLSYIERVARDIAAAMTSYKIVVDKSTVPVKTGEKVAETIKRYCAAKVEFDVVSNPEFLREGFAVGDLMKPDRVVIGVRSQRPVAAMKEIYTPFNAPIIVTDINSAELIKHAANSFLALKISYINAIATICEAAGANVQEVAHGIGLDERIGRRFLNAGIGFGGSCFPKDLSAFIKISEQVGYDFKAAQGSPAHQRRPDGPLRQKNHRHALGVEGQKNRRARPRLQAEHRRRALSPAIDLCQRLQKEGATLRVHDPKAMDKAKALLPNVTYVDDMNAVAEGCDALVVATEWDEFKKLDLARAKKSLTHPIMFDGRNLFDPAEMEKLGWIYKSVGDSLSFEFLIFS
jgi:UDPglucose 6-dehydrogenase